MRLHSQLGLLALEAAAIAGSNLQVLEVPVQNVRPLIHSGLPEKQVSPKRKLKAGRKLDPDRVRIAELRLQQRRSSFGLFEEAKTNKYL